MLLEFSLRLRLLFLIVNFIIYLVHLKFKLFSISSSRPAKATLLGFVFRVHEEADEVRRVW
jgi:hypothetical protein